MQRFLIVRGDDTICEAVQFTDGCVSAHWTGDNSALMYGRMNFGCVSDLTNYVESKYDDASIRWLDKS